MPAIFLNSSPTLRSWVGNLSEKIIKRATREKIAISIDKTDKVCFGPWRLTETTYRNPFWLSNEDGMGVYCEDPEEAWKMFLAHLPKPPQKGVIQPYKPVHGSYEPPVRDVFEAALTLFLAPLRTVQQATEYQIRNKINPMSQSFSYPSEIMDRNTAEGLGKSFLESSPYHDGGLAKSTYSSFEPEKLVFVTFTFYHQSPIKGFRNLIGENDG